MIPRLLAAVVMLTTIFVAPLAARDVTGTLAKIDTTGTITIGYRESQPPMSFVDDSGAPVGYSLDLCREIVAEIETELGKAVAIDYLPVSAIERFTAVESGKIDILCGSTTVTLARRERVDFTLLTFATGGSYMALKGSNVVNNFAGKKIGVVKNTTTLTALKELFKETGTVVEIVEFDSTEQGFTDLVSKKIDIFSADQVVLIGLALKSGRAGDFTILPDLFSFEPFALAIGRNDADFRLVADKALTRIYRSGAIDLIYDKWFGRFSKSMPSALKSMIKLNSIPEK